MQCVATVCARQAVTPQGVQELLLQRCLSSKHGLVLQVQQVMRYEGQQGLA